jgi:hypothetical protein
MNIIEKATFILKTEDCIYSPKEYREVIAELLDHVELQKKLIHDYKRIAFPNGLGAAEIERWEEAYYELDLQGLIRPPLSDAP